MSMTSFLLPDIFSSRLCINATGRILDELQEFRHHAGTFWANITGTSWVNIAGAFG
jgi:hypothetical protein